ncbi:MAG TPA: SCO family protein [Bryobacteraceae bacterium]|nr:SCO family protein [Bryobacteraceae bacterium]
MRSSKWFWSAKGTACRQHNVSNSGGPAGPVLRPVLAGAWLLLAAATLAHGEYGRPVLTRDVGLDQKLNAQIPLNLVFRNEAGQNVPLSTYFTTQPVVLALVYYRCPNLCDVTLNEMVTSLRRISLQPGKDYQVVVVSFDPRETPDLAASKKANLQKEFREPGQSPRTGFKEGWHFLTGQQDPISKLAAAVGFRYKWDARTQQFIHAGGIMIATPKGILSRYFYGVQYAPADMRMSLVTASNNSIGSPVDQLLLFCFHYDATQGKYTLAIFNVIKLAGGVTVLALGILLFFLLRHKPASPAPPQERWKEAHHVH